MPSFPPSGKRDDTNPHLRIYINAEVGEKHKARIPNRNARFAWLGG